MDMLSDLPHPEDSTHSAERSAVEPESIIEPAPFAHVLITRAHRGRLFHIRATRSEAGWMATVAIEGRWRIYDYQPFESPQVFPTKGQMVAAFTEAATAWIDRNPALSERSGDRNTT